MTQPQDKNAGSKPAVSGQPPASRLRRSQSLRQLNDVLSKVVVNLGLDQRLRENTLMNLWPVLAGSPWDKKSRPLFIDHERNLVVSVCDAPTGQELSFLKPQILKKLRVAAANLCVDIAGLRLDLKQFHAKALTDIELIAQQRPRVQPADEELQALSLTEEETMEILTLGSQLETQNVGGTEGSFAGISTQRILKSFENEIRLRHWRRLNNYPICSACKIPAEAVHGTQMLCGSCYLCAGGYGKREQPDRH